MKRLTSKGFTLVEIIVVLVIIALLVATTLPALTGYIDDAGDKVAVSEARTCQVAAQTIASELYGLGCSSGNTIGWILKGNRGSGTGMVPASYTNTVASLTGVEQFKDYSKIHLFIIDTSATITDMQLTTSNGRRVTYSEGVLSVDR